MQKQLSKKEFEEEYTLWIQSAAKDIAFAFSQLKPHEQKGIIGKSEKYLREPESVYSTEGLEFRQKNGSREHYFALHWCCGLSRRAFFSGWHLSLIMLLHWTGDIYLGSWYSIITFNRKYLEEARNRCCGSPWNMNCFQKEVYEGISGSEAKKFTPEDKRKISDETLNKAIEKSGITREEIAAEKVLMLRILTIHLLSPNLCWKQPFTGILKKILMSSGTGRTKHYQKGRRAWERNWCRFQRMDRFFCGVYKLSYQKWRKNWTIQITDTHENNSHPWLTPYKFGSTQHTFQWGLSIC